MAISSGLGVAGAVPVGSVTAFAGATAPSGWLLCYGQTVSRTQYSGLFLVLGTTYGAGDGSTTFTLPDMRGRVAAGKDDMGGSAASRLTSTVLSASNTLGATGGTQTHTMTTAEMPSHGHGVTDSGHAHSVWKQGYVGAGSGNGASLAWDFKNDYNANSITTSATTGISIQSNGSGGAHLNTQPTIVLNYIIKAA